MKFKAVIFDMDGVLIDSEPIWREALIYVFGSYNIKLTEEMCATTMGMRIDEVVNHWCRRFEIKEENPDLIVNNIVDKVISLVKEKGKVKKGVTKFLDYLNNNGYKVAIASSSYQRIIEIVVDKIDIRKYFDILVSAEFEERGKPHPAIYISTAKKLDVEPDNCLVVEDSVNGVLSAKSAGMTCLAVPDEMEQDRKVFGNADLIVDSLEDKQIYKLLNI